MQRHGLMVVEQRHDQVLVVFDRYALQQVILASPHWLRVEEFLELVFWVVLMTPTDDPEWMMHHRTADSVHRALKLSVERKRILNGEGLVIPAMDTVYEVVNEHYMQLQPLLHPLLPLIREGYVISLRNLEVDGIYVWLYRKGNPS